MESVQAANSLSSLLPCGRVVMQMQTQMQVQMQMQMQMLLPFAWSGLCASRGLGLHPPPLAGEGWGGGEGAETNRLGCPLPNPPPLTGEGTDATRGNGSEGKKEAATIETP